MAKQKIKYLVFALILITSLPVDVDSQQSDLVCGNSVQHRGFIIFGNSFQKGCYPWIVAMLTRKLGPLTFFCGGTLVSLKHVVTGENLTKWKRVGKNWSKYFKITTNEAAHCIKPKNGHPFAELKPHEVIAYFGAHDLNASNGTRITTSPVNISVHPDWDPNLQRFDADIAILVFGDGKIQYTKFIQPICLWISDDGLSETEGIVAGWGQSEDLTKPHESIPKQVTLKKIPNSDCFYDAPTLANIASNRTFCGGLSNGSGVCGGDSGNGFFILSKNLFYLDGIVSSSATTRTSCDVTKNAIYTDVSKFKSWINKTITETSSTSKQDCISRKLHKLCFTLPGEGTYCKLPNTTGLATCMLLHRCDSLFEYVKQAAYQPSNDQRAYVEQYTCGKKVLERKHSMFLIKYIFSWFAVLITSSWEGIWSDPMAFPNPRTWKLWKIIRTTKQLMIRNAEKCTQIELSVVVKYKPASFHGCQFNVKKDYKDFFIMPCIFQGPTAVQSRHRRAVNIQLWGWEW